MVMKVLTVAVLALCGAGSPRPDLSLVRNEGLDGIWQCYSYGINGQVKPDTDIWIFAGDKMFICIGNDAKTPWPVKRRPEINAQAIDLSSLQAIWRVEDDKLVICYNLGGGGRPTLFLGNHGSVLRTFRRISP